MAKKHNKFKKSINSAMKSAAKNEGQWEYVVLGYNEDGSPWGIRIKAESNKDK